MVTQSGLSAVRCGTTYGCCVRVVDLRLKRGINGVGVDSLAAFQNCVASILLIMLTPFKLLQLCNPLNYVFFPVLLQNLHIMTFRLCACFFFFRKTEIIFVTKCTLVFFFHSYQVNNSVKAQFRNDALVFLPMFLHIIEHYCVDW